jgi:HPr kinase/phosphorylase
MASILEVAARNALLKNAGHHAGHELFGALDAQLRASGAHAPTEPRERVYGVPGTRDGTGRGPGPSWSPIDESAEPPQVRASEPPSRWPGGER